MKKYLYRKQQGSQKIIVLITASLVLLLLAVSVIYFLPKKSSVVDLEIKKDEYREMSAINPEGEEPVVEKIDVFKEAAPVDIVVPEVGTVLSGEAAAGVAIPEVVVTAAPGVTAKFRSFQITAENGNFMPNQVIVNAGDTVHLDLQAVDTDYDFVLPSYNMKQTVKKGEKKILEFQALQTGRFTYYCSICGGPEQGPKGSIIVAP